MKKKKAHRSEQALCQDGETHVLLEPEIEKKKTELKPNRAGLALATKAVHGYLAHKKQPPPVTLHQDYA